MPIRPAAVAGSWYPGTAAALAAAVDRYLAAAADADAEAGGAVRGSADPRMASGADLAALIAPHAGLMYSGPVAAHAYRLLRGRRFDLIVLVGPSHFVAFDGVAAFPAGGFETPFGVAEVDAACVEAICRASAVVRPLAAPHAREHSLEMQLPFVQRLAPDARIVPLLVGRQTAAISRALGEALVASLAGRRALLVASSDLSHYHDAATAARMDGAVLDCLERFDADGLQRALDAHPDHACGGGPMVAVMRAASLLGARDAAVLRYADSGDVSGDKSSVVGYVAAALVSPRNTTEGVADRARSV